MVSRPQGDRRGEKKEVEKRKGIQLDKRALHGKLAHTEADADKVTQSRVALTEMEIEQECLFVITVFTFPLSSVTSFFKSLWIYKICKHIKYQHLCDFSLNGFLFA